MPKKQKRIVGQLPASNSKQFTLNAIDGLKILRMVAVLAAGAFVTNIAPWLLQFSYVIHGMDLTPLVTVGVAGAAEALRRFVAGGRK